MKNYFKTYYKTRMFQGILGEQFKNELTTDALIKHQNIMEGYNPGGREFGIMNPTYRANYIKHFTNFIKESYYNDLEVNWTKARDAHNHMINEQKDSDYAARFTDFMNSPRTNIILEKTMLTEQPAHWSPFVAAGVEAIKKHVKDPYKTTNIRHKGDFVDQIDDVFDTWIPSLDYIERHFNDPKSKEAPLWVQDGHNRRLENFRHLIGKENADALFKEHFPQHFPD